MGGLIFLLVLASLLAVIYFIFFYSPGSPSQDDSISNLAPNHPVKQESTHTPSFKEETHLETVNNKDELFKVTFMTYDVFNRFNGHNGENFIVTGINPDTKRKNTVHVKLAYTAEDAIAQAINMKSGKLAEPFTASPEILDVSPSEKQLSYAKNVLSHIPKGANSFDMTCLLTRYEDDDYYHPSQYLVDLGDKLHIKMSKYMGALHLCRAIFLEASLEYQLFVYIYSVMQSLINQALDESSYQICESFSKIYVADEKFMRSFKKVDSEIFTNLVQNQTCYKIAKAFYKEYGSAVHIS